MKSKFHNKLIIITLFSIFFTLGFWACKEYNVFADSETFYLYHDYGDGTKLRLSDVMIEGNSYTVRIETNLAIETGDIITWTSDNPSVISVTPAADGRSATLTCLSPGDSLVHADLIRGQNVYTADCTFGVKLAIENRPTQDSDFDYILPTDTTATGGTLVMDLELGDYKDLDLIYGNATTETIGWYSADQNVVTVDENGRVTPIGAGMTTITASTKTGNSKLQTSTVNIIVRPKFKATETSTGTSNVVEYMNGTFEGSTVYTNAKKASDLIWVVTDRSGLTIVDTSTALTSKYISLTPSSADGSCAVKAKAGEYNIYTYVKNVKDSTQATTRNLTTIEPGKAKYTQSVWVTDQTIVLNNGYSYSLADNTNIPDFNSHYTVGFDSSNHYIWEPDTDVITGTSTGAFKVTLTKITGSPLIGDLTYTINFIVNDAIRINLNATDMTVGTTQTLSPDSSVNTPLTWESSDPTVASVSTNGVVRALKAGFTTIRVSQLNTNGVLMTASCRITVYNSASLTLSKSALEMSVNESKNVTVALDPDTIRNVQITWSTDNESIIKLTPSEDGMYCTIDGLKPGTATINVRNTLNNEVKYCTVSVLDLSMIEPTEAYILYANKNKNTHKMTVKNGTEEMSNSRFTWDSTVKTVATVDANGLVTCIAPGTSTITATTALGAEVDCRITVNQLISKLTLSDEEKTIEINEGFTITCNYDPSTWLAISENITWTSTDTSVATVTKFAFNSANIKAIAGGTTTISATTVDGVVAKCVIIVKKPVTAIKLEADLTINTGQTYTFKPDITPSDSTNKTLKWASDDETVVKVDKDGKLTAVSAGENGKLSTTVTVESVNGIRAKCKVTVVQPVTGVSLSYSKKSVTKGKTFSLKETIAPVNAYNKKVTFISSDSGIATIDSNGTVKGIRGGTVIITCRTTDGNFTSFCVVSVDEKITSITLNKSTYRLGLKESFNLKATLASNYSTNQKLTWKSSNKKVVTVSSSGKITGKKLGKARITVTTTDGTKKSATCKVQVVREVSSIVLNKKSATLVVGKNVDINAKVKKSNATYKSVQWATSNKDVAMIDASGVVTGLTTGVVTITASSVDNSGVKARCLIRVIEAIPSTTVIVANQDITLITGESDVLEKNIQPANTTDGVSWVSDNSRIASVNKKTGRVVANMAGVANITITTTSGKTAKVKVTVVGLSRTNLTMEQYDTYQLNVVGYTGTVGWDVVNPNIAQVTANGTVSAKKVGTTYVRARVNGRVLICRIKVNKIS